VHGFYSVNAYSKIMTRGEQVICVSESVRDYVLENYPEVPAEKLTVIHRGVDPSQHKYGYQSPANWTSKWQSEYPQLADKYIITLPGRITRWKGPLDFVKIIKALKARGLPVHGLIVGEAHPKKLDFLEELKSAIAAEGINDDITLTGHRSDLREIMAISDVVVSCSTDPEAFGRVTLEALAIGKPVAAYAHGGVEEQLNVLLPEGRILNGEWPRMATLLEMWHQSPMHPLEDNPFTLSKMLEETLASYKTLLDH